MKERSWRIFRPGPASIICAARPGDLLRAARAGGTTAAGRIRAVADALTLASAQLAVAREYGFASWTRLRDEVTARTASLARQAEAFCAASIRDGTGRAARMLAATPELARYSFATAVILGDAGRVRTEFGRDPGLATQADTRTGWAPLHAARASRWHRLDPARAEGLLAVARMLLDAGADPNGRTGEAAGHGGWTPLRCAVAGAANPLITRLPLERGAVPGDHDLYLAGFADDNHECLRLLLFHAADVAQLARMALAAPISLNDAEGVHLLLEAGADPNRYGDDADPLSPVIYAAIRSGCSAELTGLLLGYGADPHIPGPDGARPTSWPSHRAGPGSPCCCASTAPMSPSPAPTGCWPPARTRTGPRSSGCWPPTPGCPVASPPRSRPRR